MAAPAETKVKAATGSAAAGTVVANFALWVLGKYVFHGQPDMDVVGLVNLVVAGASAYVGGWFAKHTPRPDLEKN